MRGLARTTVLVALMALGVGSVAGAQVSIRIGPPPRPRIARVQPPRPGADFVWIDGYWYPVGHQYTWHNGYWTRPPYAGAAWVAPRHQGQEFFSGYWNGDRARVDHNHRTDRARDRDYRRERR
jgi:hypothetical protein